MKHEDLRKLVWYSAWNSVANAITCADKKSATIWADSALKDFDERFPKQDTAKENCVDYTNTIFCSLISSDFYASTIDESNCVTVVEQANIFSKILNNKLKQM